MSVVELVGELALRFGKDVYMKSLEPIFMHYLTNTAASVREMGIKKVAFMAISFKSDWVMNSFLPKIVETYAIEKQGFNFRMACLMSLSAVMPALQKDQISEKVIPTLVLACSDKIPNVQFCVARIIKANKSLIDPGVLNSQIVPKLKDMTQDGDKDVAYFATIALYND